MKQRARVVLAGAGSASFGLASLKGLLESPFLHDMELVLLDPDEAALQRMGQLGQFLTQRSHDGRSVRMETEAKKALEGADVVILSVASQREELWRRDRERALALGINHYAENGGPAALFHAARNLCQILPILWTMESVCPDAWVLNYTNPVPRIGTAIRQASSIRSVGVCHQLGFGYFMAGVLLAPELGISVPSKPRFRWNDESVAWEHQVSKLASSRIRLHAAGLNHFTWALNVIDRSDGQDLYPLLRQRNREVDSGFEPLTRAIFSLTDFFPVPGDCHMAEYLPYAHNLHRKTFEHWDIQMYDFSWSHRVREARRDLALEVFGTQNLALLDQVDTERVELLAAALLGRRDHFDESLNLPNQGAVTGLSEDAIVETPAYVEAGRIRAIACGSLPLLPQSWAQRQIQVVELATEGLLTGTYGKLAQALALDPMIDDLRLVPLFLKAYDEELARLWRVLEEKP